MSVFGAAAPQVAPHIPLVPESHMAKPEVNGAGKDAAPPGKHY